MSEKNLFEEMMANNPYLSMSEDNPFMAMLKNNPYLSMSEDNPFMAMLKTNPLLSTPDGNPFLAMFKDNPMLSEDNPFWAAMKDWQAAIAGGNPFLEMLQNIPYVNLYSEWQQAMIKMWDMWLVGLGGLSWTQNQIENATRKQLGEMKAVREDLTKLAQDMSRQAAKNQAVILEVLEDAVISEQE
ncbi:MAG: hypothetical protein ABRQ24_10695 [Syntrophomonadaceae bacterium]